MAAAGTRVALKTCRVFLCASCVLYSKITAVFPQMSLRGVLQNAFTFFSRYRKIFVVVLLLLIAFLYIQPSVFHLWKSDRLLLRIDKLDVCIRDRSSALRNEAGPFDVFLSPGDDTSHVHVPYVGNGRFSTVVSKSGRINVRNGRALSLAVNYFPVVTPSIIGHTGKSVDAVNIKSGIVHTSYCFKRKNQLCILVDRKVYAHRSRPSLLVQEFKFYNPQKRQSVISLERSKLSEWKDAKSQPFQTTSKKGQATLISGTTSSGETTQFVSIAMDKVPSTIAVGPGMTVKYYVIAAVDYIPLPSNVSSDSITKKHQEQLKKIYDISIGIDITVLQKEHVLVWEKLWYSGFGISFSRAPDVVNGDKINLTLYYVLSNVPSPIQEVDVKVKERTELERLLDYPDRCYDNHHTLQLHGSSLWGVTDSESSVTSLVNSWLVTLEKSGCSSLIKAGADGVIQAMMLSFGGFIFKDQHLEFKTQPSDLHRDYFFRRINYGNNTHVNVSVIVGEDNKATLYVALDRNDRPYYACDAGCLDVVKLTEKVTRFPVKLTEPPTAILYITSDKEHMDGLKHTIHVKTLQEAPAHEHHVIALHRHGHHLGGLPTIFWVSIAILVVIFHMFLFKLIFNEYCNINWNASRTSRGKYNL